MLALQTLAAHGLVALHPLLLPSWFNPERIIELAGPWALWVVAIIIFAECGIFSLLPGDSLLFTVGMLIAGVGTQTPAIAYGSPVTTLVVSCVVLSVVAVLGNVAGYQLGRAVGPALFKPRTGFMGKVFDPQHVQRTQNFYDSYGARALVLARFVPLVRTFVTLIAGVARMDFRTFIAWTAVGGVLWATGVTVLGYFLGQVPFIHDHIEMVLIAVVVVSVIPMAVEFLMGRRKSAAA
ncbi:DedA family protein [Aestuariimicrobium soli]|uniref:DedA family protein n=1 Tax=Aestuariimicrobium soli TaxID=2035834 RepID=UPI003EBC798D